jgi:hypothetical protein
MLQDIESLKVASTFVIIGPDRFRASNVLRLSFSPDLTVVGYFMRELSCPMVLPNSSSGIKAHALQTKMVSLDFMP